MRLFIMRHGPSEGEAPSGKDFDRSLSADGRVRTAAVARELQRRGEHPTRIVSSPLVRAVETAKLVQSAFGGIRIDMRDELAPGADTYGLVLELLDGLDESVLLVSHAPDVSLLVERVLGGRSAAFSPATIVALELADGHASRRFVLNPAEIEH
jgi:phosphohistidine phosphatase